MFFGDWFCGNFQNMMSSEIIHELFIIKGVHELRNVHRFQNLKTDFLRLENINCKKNFYPKVSGFCEHHYFFS